MLQPPPSLRRRTPANWAHPWQKPCDGWFNSAVACVLGDGCFKNAELSIAEFRFYCFLQSASFVFLAVASVLAIKVANFLWVSHFLFHVFAFCLGFLLSLCQKLRQGSVFYSMVSFPFFCFSPFFFFFFFFFFSSSSSSTGISKTC